MKIEVFPSSFSLYNTHNTDIYPKHTHTDTDRYQRKMIFPLFRLLELVFFLITLPTSSSPFVVYYVFHNNEFSAFIALDLIGNNVIQVFHSDLFRR